MIRPTRIIDDPALAAKLGLKQLLLASETGQHTGSFKFRAAYNVVSKVPQKLILTASSGNFGQAVAYACKLLGKQCIVVMPKTSARTKIAAVKEHGGVVELIDVKTISRAGRVAQVAQKYPEAYVASAYDDPFVIEGNATLGKELAAITIDCIMAPVGGGGLTSGIITGLREEGSSAPVIGVEPLLANDAARSFRAGKLVSNESEPTTIADGVRTVSLGKRNWEILKERLSRVIEVPEELIPEAMRMLFNFEKIKAEPTGALSLAGVLTELPAFTGKSVCCVISGGNVDPELFQEILELNPSP
jgi:threonine dehydratase